MSIPAFSSEVVLTLVVNGQEFALSHTNSNDVILRDTVAQSPATDAELVVKVDGITRKQKINLPNGISPHEKRVAYQVAAI